MHPTIIANQMSQSATPRDSDNRKHQCHSCPLSFKRREHYQRHLRSHTKERPFTCRHCSRSFSRKDLVLRHIRKLHVDGEYLEIHNNNFADCSRPPASIGRRRSQQRILMPSPGNGNIRPKESDYVPAFSTTAEATPAGPRHSQANTVRILNASNYAPKRGQTVDNPIDVDHASEVSGHLSRTDAHNHAGPAGTQGNVPLRPLEPRPLAMKVAAVANRPKQPSVHPHVVPATGQQREVHFAEEASTANVTENSIFSQKHDYANSGPELTWNYLKTYFSTFNLHFPLFHVPTFDYREEPQHLVLIMAAFGAMYQREQQVATALYYSAEAEFASNRLSSDAAELPRHVSLAGARTLLLLVIFGAFNGNRQMANRALNRLTRLSACYEMVASTVKLQAIDQYDSTELSWQEWIGIEARKRFLHGTWILYDLVLATYNLPGLRIYETEVELPSLEAVWLAASEQQWRLERSTTGSRRIQSIRDAMSLISPDTSDVLASSSIASSWSAFAVVVVMHVLSVFTSNSPADTKSATTLDPVIPKAQSLLWSMGLSNPSQWENSRPDHTYNASAALRSASIRPYSKLIRSDRTSMLSGDIRPASEAVAWYTKEQFPRSQMVTEAMAQAFEGLLIPGSGETMMIHQQGPLLWSLEHLVAAWDTIIIVSKWLHTVQVNSPEFYETALMGRIAQTLQKNGYRLGGLLSADLCRFWAVQGEEFWIWAVSTRMVAVLKSLADAYEQSG